MNLRSLALFCRATMKPQILFAFLLSYGRLSAFLAAMLVCLSLDSSAREVQQQPNVLLIVSDDLNCRVSSYGDRLVHTPNIDRLARRGVLFERAYAQYPVCNPSRCSFLSGRRPESTGILDNTVGIRTKCPDIVTLPQCLRQSGWFTAGIAKIFHVDQWDPPRPEDRPGSWKRDDPLAWDFRLNTKTTEVGRQGDRMELAGKSFPRDTLNFRLMADGTDDDQDDGQTTVEVIKLLRQKRDKPFFIGAGFRRPHAAWIAPRQYFGAYPLDQLSLPDPGSREGVPPLAFSNTEPNYGVPDEMLHLLQGYVATVSFLDAQIGRLLDELDRLELADNTIIVFFGDHGFHLGEHGLWHKHTLFEESTRTPLIIAGPGIPAGRRCRRTVELLDVFPTLADLCGVEPPADLEGTSLRPLLEDPEAAWNRPAFTVERSTWKGRPVLGRSIRTERWRYTQWDEGREGHELYDHHTDPREHMNIANDPQMADIVQQLSTQLHPAEEPQPNVNGRSKWQVVHENDSWRLLKDGQPFYIQGAVGWNRFDVLRRCGGNAVRTRARRALLDAAQQEGLAVMANLPVRGDRDGLDWGDAEQVAEQRRRVLAVVEEFRSHPAVMFWAIGNELDHIPGPKTHHPDLWRRLNDLAVAIKRIDKHHPVMTVVGTGRFEQKVQQIARECPAMDLLGINCYGDIESVTELVREHWPSPYAITEWGPTGHWQVPKTKWRVPLEQTSSEKARAIRKRYENTILADTENCLGSFVFYWSEKQETTHTWYGLFRDGLRTESIDVMQHLWTGVWPENRAPTIHGIAIDGRPDARSAYLVAGRMYRVGVHASDPDGDPLTYVWDIRPEVEIPPGSYAGSKERRAKPIEGLIRDPARRQVEFTAPSTAGPYRIFVTILDGKEHAAYGNVPFFVTQD